MVRNDSSEQEPITERSSVRKSPPKIKIDEKNVGLRITCLAVHVYLFSFGLVTLLNISGMIQLWMKGKK